jgi:mannose-6-phosphate isomerase-like protein (cupin superfamily)
MSKNIYQLFRKFDEQWSPKIVGEVNDVYIKIAKIEGEFVWHQHENEDEFFMVIQGEMTIQYQDREDVHLSEGDFHVVHRGIRHNPKAECECHIMMIEKKETSHSGDAKTAHSVAIEDQVIHEDL